MHKDNIKNSADNADSKVFLLNVPKIDYLEYSSNHIPFNVFEELRTAQVKEARGDRFYKWLYDSQNYVLRLGQKNKKLRASICRVKHEALPYVIELGLPEESTITRIDICIDVKTKEEALALTMCKGLGYSAYIDSRAQAGGGETYYFGERTRQIFERVYWKPSEGGWRYEVEIKPQSKRLPAYYMQLDERIRKKFCRVLKAMRLKKSECYTPLALMACTLPPPRQREIDFVFSFEFMTKEGRNDFYLSLREVEREYLETLRRTTESEQNKNNWEFIDKLKYYLGK